MITCVSLLNSSMFINLFNVRIRLWSEAKKGGGGIKHHHHKVRGRDDDLCSYTLSPEPGVLFQIGNLSNRFFLAHQVEPVFFFFFLKPIRYFNGCMTSRLISISWLQLFQHWIHPRGPGLTIWLILIHHRISNRNLVMFFYTDDHAIQLTLPSPSETENLAVVPSVSEINEQRTETTGAWIIMI